MMHGCEYTDITHIWETTKSLKKDMGIRHAVFNNLLYKKILKVNQQNAISTHYKMARCSLLVYNMPKYYIIVCVYIFTYLMQF